MIWALQTRKISINPVVIKDSSSGTALGSLFLLRDKLKIKLFFIHLLLPLAVILITCVLV